MITPHDTAVVGGFFIDGSGWTPPPTYDQTSRGWFMEAMKAPGVYLTDPYLPAQGP